MKLRQAGRRFKGPLETQGQRILGVNNEHCVRHSYSGAESLEKLKLPYKRKWESEKTAEYIYHISKHAP